MIDAPQSLRDLVDRLEDLAARRLVGQPRSEAAAGRALRLRDHLAGHIRTRVRRLDAPLLVVLIGPTGAGKSSLFNALAGESLSPTGVLRPTTRMAVVLAHRDDRGALVEGSLAGLGPDRFDLVEGPGEPGLALVDAPDVDSIEHANRELSDRLVEAADLAVFVTTATRYADRVPWAVLERARERGLPLVVVVNRMPPDPAERGEVLRDVTRLFAEAGLIDLTRSVPAEAAPVEMIGVAEGELDRASGGTRLAAAAIAPIAVRIAHLREDRDARLELAARALAGSLGGLGPLVDAIADDAEHEAIDVAALHRDVRDRYDRELGSLRGALQRGTFLREEALRHWQAFVGADEITRLFAKGIGRLRGILSAIVSPVRAPVAEVRQATTDDIVALARLHAGEAARRTATAWADEPVVGVAVGDDPALWGPSADFEERLRDRIAVWIGSIAEDIQATGRPKRMLARGAAVGVSALGTGVMLATFIHTAGLTGVEVGVAAGTAFLNHRLLSALFGEAAMVELVDRARQRLDDTLATTFDEERLRFDALVPSADDLVRLAADLREAGADVRRLPPDLGRGLQPVMDVPVATRPEPRPARGEPPT
ncbi:MAG: dynamin family protein [Chloroflexota bacterium]